MEGFGSSCGLGMHDSEISFCDCTWCDVQTLGATVKSQAGLEPGPVC